MVGQRGPPFRSVDPKKKFGKTLLLDKISFPYASMLFFYLKMNLSTAKGEEDKTNQPRCGSSHFLVFSFNPLPISHLKENEKLSRKRIAKKDI